MYLGIFCNFVNYYLELHNRYLLKNTMKYLIIMPAYNEADYILSTLRSIVEQTLLPTYLLVVDDNSSDNTYQLVKNFIVEYPWINIIKRKSEAIHLPGSKVIQAFNYGLQTIQSIDDFDIIVKLDADLILPPNYFEKIVQRFSSAPRIGMVGGFAYILKEKEWCLENLTNKDHIRGAFKAYKIDCFKEIGGLKPAMGWDTVDELLCNYYEWEIITLPELKVKHLKPTGIMYNKKARYNQGKAFYHLSYGFTLTFIASLKLAFKKKNPLLFFDYMIGYFKALRRKEPFLVNNDQAKFIREYRWKKIRDKFL